MNASASEVAGANGVVIVSAGFAETDTPGAASERKLVMSARRGGMRLVGPRTSRRVSASRVRHRRIAQRLYQLSKDCRLFAASRRAHHGR